MDCLKCLELCQAECCSDMVPLPAEFFDRHQADIVTLPTRVERFMGYKLNEKPLTYEYQKDEPQEEIEMAIVTTANRKCCFLKNDQRCACYEDRPIVCKKFGDESHLFLKCSWQDKDGRMRSRQEKRSLERKSAKECKKFQQIGRKLTSSPYSGIITNDMDHKTDEASS